jgi:CHAT domain-containing protein
LLSDLASAYFERGQTSNRPRDLIVAGECAVRAQRLAPTSAEAAWNRAVVLETLGVRAAASAAWSDYLRIDGVSPWSSEARRRLGGLNAPALAQLWVSDREKLLDAAGASDVSLVARQVASYPEQARSLVEEDLLSEWAEARARNDEPAAKRALDKATVIGEAVARISHDTMARDAVAAASNATTPERLGALISGHRHYFAGRRVYRSSLHEQAHAELAAAEADLSRGNSPLALRAAMFNATTELYLGHPQESLRIGQSVIHRAAPDYPVVIAQMQWTCGLAAMAIGSLDEALEHHLAALQAFRRTQETSNLAGLAQVVSDDYRAVGNIDNAWLYQLQSFDLASRYATFERAHLVVNGGALSALRDGFPNLADELQQGVVERARQSRQPLYICDALLRYSETLTALSRPADARAAIEEAFTAWAQLPASAIKSRLRADLEMARASVVNDLSPPQRLAALDRAMQAVTDENSRSRIAKIFLLRGRAQRDGGNHAAAERDFEAGIAEVEAQRDKTTTDETRQTFLTTAAGLYDELVEDHLARGDEEGAFDLLERRRARWLLDRFQGDGNLRTAGVRPWQSLRAAIPPGVVVLSYSVGTGIDTWIASASTIKHVRLDARPEELTRTVDAWRAALTAQEGLPSEKATLLHELLIRPLRSEIGAARAVVIIPDRFLHAVPFAALRDRATGHYLVEDFALMVAPSANLYVDCLERTKRAGGPQSALIVANPATNDPALPSLGGADSEGAAVAALLPSALLVHGKDATLDRFRTAAPSATFIHFAGHALINPVRPELSSLIFATGPDGTSSRLYARDLYRMRLPRTDLVVLAACNSATGRFDGDAPLSLASSFVAAGVPATIASLWPVDDTESARFFGDVYRAVLAGHSPAEALREAQIAALRTGTIPQATWAAYQVIGGSRM